MTALTDLLAALESGDDRPIKIAVLAINALMPSPVLIERAYSGDTQAAIDFIKAALPGYTWQVSSQPVAFITNPGVALFQGDGPTPARALLIAAVKALVAKEAGG